MRKGALTSSGPVASVAGCGATAVKINFCGPTIIDFLGYVLGDEPVKPPESEASIKRAFARGHLVHRFFASVFFPNVFVFVPEY